MLRGTVIGIVDSTSKNDRTKRYSKYTIEDGTGTMEVCFE